LWANVLNFIGATIMASVSLFSWAILLKEKLDLRNLKIYITIVLIIIFLLINYNSLIKFTICTLLFSIVIKFVFKRKFSTSLITALFTQTINIFSEFIFSILIIFVFKFDFDATNINDFIILFADIFVSIFCILMVTNKLIKKLYDIIFNIISKLKIKYILITVFAIIFFFNSYIQLTYYKIDTFYVFLLNNISIYIVVIIIAILAKKENDYNKIYNKYNTTLNTLKEYEDILDKYRVMNHENKNQLLTIRNMLTDNNKDIRKYIDEITDNKLKDDDKIMKEVSIIPAGGLRGLVYSKILYINQNHIKYELNISKNIRTVDLINNLENSDMLDICQIIGVYIDNAIESVIKLKKKHINIEMYLEKEKLIFAISNNYDGKIEISKLDQKGYTTKGYGHGYGLSLTKKIIQNNKKLENEKKLTNQIFTQILKIKM
jgi:two-component system sensor histidine kinase AgrC